MRHGRRRIRAFGHATEVVPELNPTRSSGTVATGSADRQTVRIAYIGDYSLDEAPALVAPAYQGASLAAEAATDSGRLPVDLEVVSYDTDGDPQRALEIASEIGADPQIVGGIMAPFTLESKGVGQVLDSAGLATMSLSSLDPTLSTNGWTNWRRPIATGATQARALASFAGSLPAARRGVCLSGDGSARSTALQKVAGLQLGAQVAGRSTLVASDEGAAKAVAGVRKAGCGVVVWTGAGARGAALRLGLSASGGSVTVVATDATKTDAYLAATGRASEGTVVACSCVDLTTSSRLEAQRFINAFQFDVGTPPGPYAVEGWDAGNLFVDVVRTGAISRTQVAERLRDVRDSDGLAGSIAIGPTGELVDPASNLRFYRAEGGRWLALGAFEDRARSR